MTGWSLGPIVYTEIDAPEARKKDDEHYGEKKRAYEASSSGYGRWLDRGFWWLRWAGELLFLSVGVVYPLGYGCVLFSLIALAVTGNDPLKFLDVFGEGKTLGDGGLAAGGGVGAAAAGGGLGFRWRLGKRSVRFAPGV